MNNHILASLYVIGAFVGSLGGGLQSEYLGRKYSIIINNIVVLVGLLCLRFSTALPLLLIGRIMTGYSNGANRSCLGPYTSEVCQPGIRKTTATFSILFYTLGYAILFWLGVELHWRDVLSIVIAFPCVFSVLMCISPKSPTWLMNRGSNEKALAEMIRLRRNVDAANIEIDRLRNNMKKQRQFSTESKEDFFMKRLLVAFKQETFLRPFTVLLVITTLGFHWTGSPTLSFYLVTTLQKSKLPIEPYTAAAIISCYRLGATIICTFVSTCIRRRPLYIGCCLANAIGCFLLGTSAYLVTVEDYIKLQEDYDFIRWFPFIAILLMYTGISGGMTSTAFALFSELLPSNARGFGTGVLSAIGFTSLFCSTKFTPNMEELLGFHGMFWLFSVVGFGVAIFSFFCIPETFGLNLEDIEEHYRKISNSSKPEIDVEKMQQMIINNHKSAKSQKY